MGRIKAQWREGMTRRDAPGRAGWVFGRLAALRAQQDARLLSEHTRALGINEMQNVWDFELCLGRPSHVTTSADYTATGMAPSGIAAQPAGVRVGGLVPGQGGGWPSP